MNTTLAASIALALGASPSLAGAQAVDTATTLDGVVVTGTRVDAFGVKSGIALERMPQSIQVIGDATLEDVGTRSIEDALRVVPSATIAGSRIGTSTSATLRVRGFAAQVMRNGIRQRFYEGVDASALSNIQRIEVLKGPSGVLYGQSGVGGLVSVITKQPTTTFSGETALSLGSHDRRALSLDVGGPLGESVGVRVTGEIERSGTFVDAMDLDRENAGLALAWRPDARVSGHLVAEYLRRRTRNNPGLPTVGTVLSNGVATVGRDTFLGEPGYSLQENHAPLVQGWLDIRLAETWTLTPRVQYSEFNNTSRSTTLLPPVEGEPTRIQRVGRNAGEEDDFRIAQLDLSGRARLLGVEHELLMGVEYSTERVNFRMHDSVPCGVGPIDALVPVYGCGAPTAAFGFLSEAHLDGFAVYAQDQVALSDRWQVIGGLRHSQFDNDNTFTTAFSSTAESARLRNTTWQLGTTFELGGGVSAFAGYNTGYDLEWVIGARNRDGRPFQPETSDQAEVGLRWSGERMQASASLFRIRRDDVAVPDPADLGFQVQDGRFEVRGVELEGHWQPRPALSLQAGYAYMDAQIARSSDPAMIGARLAETPRHGATATARWTLDRVDLHAAGRHVGERHMINGGTVVLPGYTVFDIGVGADFGAWRGDAALTNLFDRVYYYSDNLFVYSIGTEDRVLPGDPRTLGVRLRYRFGG
ncbi:TonB-dependent siderophore receptor [Luteimonas abyssi]|uniref:TonB-dependent siderophore receptor n=1 Tax=Luteimonas abyssi TaxID=1247514 RepID=UPI000737CFB4|nr:TonB-dependent siderophore receptor [Luteimonas abyssi]